MENIWQQLSKEISDRIAQAGRSVVAVDSHGRHTSAGIIWNQEFVLTSSLAVPRDNEVGIIFESGKVTSARVAGRAPALGVALLKPDRKIDAVPAELPPADDRRAAGTPAGRRVGGSGLQHAIDIKLELV